MYTLIKLSSPGWEKDLNTLEDVEITLYPLICSICKDEISKNSNYNDILDTACGCEYRLVYKDTQEPV